MHIADDVVKYVPLPHLQVAYDQIKNAPSRGALTTDFLLGSSEPLQYLRGLKAEV